jgi:hypothetical protein
MTSGEIQHTLIIYGRYWYDFLTIAWVMSFFLIEMVLLFRNSLLGWSMTVKCLVLAGVFLFSLVNPPDHLPPEDITIAAVLIRLLLIVVLGWVIVILAVMRLRRITIWFVSREGVPQEDQQGDANLDFLRDVRRHSEKGE